MITELRAELEAIYKDFFEISEICEFFENDIFKPDVCDLLSRIEYLNEEITKIELLEEEDVIIADFFEEFLDQDIDLAPMRSPMRSPMHSLASELIEDEVDWAKEGF